VKYPKNKEYFKELIPFAKRIMKVDIGETMEITEMIIFGIYQFGK